MLAPTASLRAIPLFAGCTDRSIEMISGIVQPAAFAPGEVLVREGDAGDSLIVIVRGVATVEQGGRQFRQLGAGDFLGEIALIDGGPRTATVTATEPIEALTIGREGFRRLMDEFPIVRYDLVSALTRRLRDRGTEPSD